MHTLTKKKKTSWSVLHGAAAAKSLVEIFELSGQQIADSYDLRSTKIPELRNELKFYPTAEKLPKM